MQWIRRHIRHGAHLALAALVLQLALSFGHVHAGPVSATPVVSLQDVAASSADADHNVSAAVQNDADNDHAPSPTPPDGCAICAVMALAGNVLSVQPPVLLLPDALDVLYRTTDAGFLHLDFAHAAFQPRAPPAS